MVQQRGRGGAGLEKMLCECAPESAFSERIRRVHFFTGTVQTDGVFCSSAKAKAKADEEQQAEDSVHWTPLRMHSPTTTICTLPFRSATARSLWCAFLSFFAGRDNLEMMPVVVGGI